MSTLELITPYAKKFNKAVLDAGYNTSSPLGLWLLLALGASNSRHLSDETVKGLEELLDMPLADATEQARKVLLSPPDSLKAAVGSWSKVDSETLSEWEESVQGAITSENSIPSQETLNEWVKDNSYGILEEFPRVDETVIFILASILASKVSWNQELSPAAPLGCMKQWGTKKVMLSAAEHPVFIAKVDGQMYGVHVATSSDAMRVYSVISTDENTPADVVMDAAYAIAQEDYEVVDSWDDAEKGVGEVLSVSTTTSNRKASAFLPAWDSNDSLELTSVPGVGADLLVRAFSERIDGETVGAVLQEVKASYHKAGFEAAALTSMMIMRSATPPPTYKQLVVSFSRPYAALAVAVSQEDVVPAFNTWVTKASEVE